MASLSLHHTSTQVQTLIHSPFLDNTEALLEYINASIEHYDWSVSKKTFTLACLPYQLQECHYCSQNSGVLHH